MFAQLPVQIIGIVLNIVWGVGIAIPLLIFIKKVFGLRVSPEEEMAGVTLDGSIDAATTTTEGTQTEGMSEEDLLALAEGKSVEPKQASAESPGTGDPSLVVWIKKYMSMPGSDPDVCRSMLAKRGWASADIEKAIAEAMAG